MADQTIASTGETEWARKWQRGWTVGILIGVLVITLPIVCKAAYQQSEWLTRWTMFAPWLMVASSSHEVWKYEKKGEITPKIAERLYMMFGMIVLTGWLASGKH